jgi:dTDP-4-amino-4,6-dideoxygalactose transaminase
LYVLRVMVGAASTAEQSDLQTQLSAAGINSGIHYPLPCHLQPAFAALGYRSGDFPVAELLSKEILSLPMYPGLTETQITRTVKSLVKS